MLQMVIAGKFRSGNGAWLVSTLTRVGFRLYCVQNTSTNILAKINDTRTMIVQQILKYDIDYKSFLKLYPVYNHA